MEEALQEFEDQAGGDRFSFAGQKARDAASRRNLTQEQRLKIRPNVGSIMRTGFSCRMEAYSDSRTKTKKQRENRQGE
jgi:hypothetical protein